MRPGRASTPTAAHGLRRRHARALRGFTLVEVLVALVVMSILAGLAWQAVDGMTRSRRAVEEKSSGLVLMGTALAQWEQDLQSVLGEGPLPTLQFDGARLRVIRRVPQGAQLVVWSLRQGVWQRWAGPTTQQEAGLIQAWERAAQLQGQEPGHVTLAQGVTSWQLYFFRGNGWSNAQSSGDVLPIVSSPVAASGPQAQLPRERLPQGVRLVLSLEGESGSGNLTRDVLVPGGQP